jgi:hypothetical protein
MHQAGNGGWCISQKDGWKEKSSETNYQNLPDKVPEVKDYTGWDHMQCDMDAGR